MKPALVLLLALFLVVPSPACAYLDPGSGSIMLQLLLGGVAGLFVIVKVFWHRILALLGIGKGSLREK